MKMTREALKRTTCLAVAGAFALALAGTATAAPLSLTGKAAISDQASIQPVVYHHHYHHYRHYGVGAAVAGTAMGLIGGAIAASQYPYYGYGYGPGPYYGHYYGYGYGPGGYW
jgi:hypothetical protein